MKRTSLLLALSLATALPAFAADVPEAPSRYAATIAPAERFEVGAMLVERHGSQGCPMVLIPGLAGGTWVWQGMVREFSRDHVVYVVTLPGFDGRAPAGGDEMDTARKALLELLTSRHLDKPVLVGHSLGGVLALALAEESPGLVGGVVSIDGLPVFPGTEGMPAEQRLQAAQAARARSADTTGPAFAAQQQRYMRGIGVLDMSMADELAKLSAKSDPGAVAGYVAGALALDLRPGLPKISAPVLVLAPYFDADAAQQQISQQDKVAYYQSLMAGTPKLTVVPVAPSRHFAMFDQPAIVVDAIRRYLNVL
jgi:pimeloyl-ACP methyl ester carboxylesterase